MVYSALKGRIGNNLFQIAAGLSLAKRNDSDFAAYVQNILLPEPDNCLLTDYLDQFQNNILRNIKLIDLIPLDVIKYNEPSFCYSLLEYKPNILLDGYFQSAKYFDEDLIRRTFAIDEDTKNYINLKFGYILAHDITSINVRRGDYTTIPEYHPPCSVSYYRNAIKYIGSKKNYLIISDDILWCKINFKGDNFLFVENENPVVDLYLQTLCANNIVSNSSFSWWGAWLNPNPDKLVIAPSKNWVGKLHPLQDTKDILPEEWIKLANPLKFSIRVRVFLKRLVLLLIAIKKNLKMNS